MEFLPRTLLYYMLSHGYLYFVLLRHTKKRRLVLAAFPLFAVMGLFPYIHGLLPDGSMAQKLFARAGAVWQPLAFGCLLAVLGKDLVSLSRHLGSRRFPQWGAPLSPASRRKLLELLLACAVLYAYGISEAHSLRVRHLELPLAAASGAERLRIVFAADLHIGPQTGLSFLRRTVDAINDEDPDIILLGGDILDDALQGTSADREALRQLRARLGIFAVLGNHDAFGGHEHALDFVRSCGIRVLADEMLPLGPLTLLGIDDPDVRAQKGNKDADAAALTAGRPSGVPLVLLTHRPRLLPDSVGHFDLQLSGHTHGGQIGLVEPLLKRAYGTPTGLSRHTSPAGESLLYVTTGVGFSKLPIRLGAPPEIVVIDLVPSAAGGRP